MVPHFFTKQTHIIARFELYPKGWTVLGACPQGACHLQRPRHSQKHQIPGQRGASERDQDTAGYKSTDDDPAQSRVPWRYKKKSSKPKDQLAHAPAPKHGRSQTGQARGGQSPTLNQPQRCIRKNQPLLSMSIGSPLLHHIPLPHQCLSFPKDWMRTSGTHKVTQRVPRRLKDGVVFSWGSLIICQGYLGRHHNSGTLNSTNPTEGLG